MGLDIFMHDAVEAEGVSESDEARRRPSPQEGGEAAASVEVEAEAVASGGTRKIAWGEIRQVCELTDVPTIEILKRYGLTGSQLRWRRESEKWQARPATSVQRTKAEPAERLKAHTFSLCAMLLVRLEEWIARTEKFEISQARAVCVVAAAVAHLTRSDEREEFLSMARQAQKSRTATIPREEKNNDAGYDFRDDPAWLDAEINRRLDRLQQSGAGSDAGAADAGAKAGTAGDVERRVGEG